MCKLKFGILAIMLTAGITLFSGCSQMDENVLNTEADFSVSINVPYATATPLPDHLNVPDAVVIDSNGSVTINDDSLLANTSKKADVDSSGYHTLSLGDTGLAVQTLQQRLQDLGYFSGGVSGIFDAETETAVERFEQTFGIMQTGIATPTFQVQLFSSSAPIYGSDEYESAVVSQYSTLQRGAIGSSVYALQHRLKELGYPIDELTAVYDEATENAVQLFYQAYGLEPNTVAYIALQKELYSENAREYSADGETKSIEIDENTLVPGNVGTLVMQIQNRLIELGYMSTTASGIYDTATENAVRAFEEACGFEPSGMLTYSMQAILLSDQAPAYGSNYTVDATDYSDLAEGDQGDEVAKLQNRLIELGYATGAGNGVYGSETAAAIRMFQHYNHLDEDGLASAYVQAVLYSPTAISYEDVLNGITVKHVTSASEDTSDADDVPYDFMNGGFSTLAKGETGSTITKLQERLNELKYTCSVNSVFDDETEAAVRLLQANIGVAQTGEVNASLQQYIYTKAVPANGYRMHNSTQTFTALSEGDTGDAVTQLQQRLWKLGYLLTEDVQDSIGTFHDKTRDAVINAQIAMGYESPDGVATAEFQCFIFSEYSTFIQQ